MSDKLYLIRRNLESFLGPLTFDEVRRSYRKMEFGLQDEIAASFREWVNFDDLERIKEMYPEIADFVRKEMLSGWGVSRHPNKPKRDRSTTPARSEKTRKRAYGAALASVIMAVAGVAFFMARNGELASKFFAADDPNPERARELMNDEKGVLFENYMERYRREVAAQAQKAAAFKEWLPLMRVYAYRREGRFEGMQPQFLRGVDNGIAPKDCTLATWKKLWQSSRPEWDGFIKGTSLPQADWARLLAWDPHWILHRSPERGWLNPESYYEGCILMAQKSLIQLGTETKDGSEARENILARLNWLVSMLKGESVGSEISMSGTLWAISCLESSEKREAIEECHKATELGRDWDGVFRARMLVNHARTVIARGPTLGVNDIEELRQLIPQIRARDPYTRFDYDLEIRFYQQVMITSGRVQKAADHVNERFPEVRFP